jgi:hypothetical protein
MAETDITINTATENVSVIIDTSGPNLYPISNLINNLIQNYSKIESAATSVINNSAVWFNYNEVEQLGTLQTLSSTWVETYTEMNTIQDSLSTNWQQTYQNDVSDGGFF